ncbi:MAG: hypothetical protein EXQ66_07565 [Ilumatobacteraceae bacterium]|nr:hypothetical protein [Ilumatobacteraceae bacterium]
MSETRTIQFRLVMGKGDERVFGPDDADTVATIAKADATMDLSVAFMKSKLKIAGATGPLFDALSSGQAATIIAELLQAE